MFPVKQKVVVVRSCYIHLVYLAMISGMLASSEGIPTSREAKQSDRSVIDCAAGSAVRLVRCGYTDGCISAIFRCDGTTDCDDGSDESDATCTGGSACEESQVPLCPGHSTCRSVPASETRLAHHVCDCVAPFTGANCTEMRTTAQVTIEATEKETTYSSKLATESNESTMTPGSHAFTTRGTTSTQTSANEPQSSRVFTTEFNTTHLPDGSMTMAKTSSPITEDTRPVVRPSTTAAVTDQVTQPSSPTTQNHSDPKTNVDSTNNVTNTGTSDVNPSTAASLSTPAGTSSTFPSTESTQQSTIGKIPRTTDNSTELIPHRSTSVPTLATPGIDDGHNHAAQTVDSSSTPHPNSPPQGGDSRNQNPGTTPVLVVVFGLITLMPLAIFFHCRVRRTSGFKVLTPKPKKEDENVDSGDTQENSRANHKRNSSISSIKLKENSTLLGNELPLDINMNKPAPIPPIIVVTPPPDNMTESLLETQRTKKKKRPRKQQNLPDTLLWYPEDGETPYFVTDNVPLPVSLV